ncbi:MAG: 3-hexulose-6-phosphate synthase, partial [Oscillospiraceae bacterium]
MKKLQAALDLFDTKKKLEVLEKIGKYLDIIEIGTPLCIAEGMSVVRTVKEKYPNKIVFADIKVMDGGSVVSKVALDAGADMVSVLAAAEDNTVRATIECAHKAGKKALVDMCAVKDMEGRAQEIAAMNPDYICCHVGYDIQATGVDPIEELRRLDGVSTPKAIAGGIKMETFEAAVNSPADVIIVGGGLYNHENMEELAKKMHEIIVK